MLDVERPHDLVSTLSKATPPQVERAVAALRFGCVTHNGWSVLGYMAACKGASWGAHPDSGPRSGCGLGGNGYGHAHVVKTVVRPPPPSPPLPSSPPPSLPPHPRCLFRCHLLPSPSPGARAAALLRAAFRRHHSIVKVPPWQCPRSAPAPPRGAPGGSGRLNTPKERQGQWSPSHRLGCSSQPPPKSPRSPPLTL